MARVSGYFAREMVKRHPELAQVVKTEGAPSLDDVRRRAHSAISKSSGLSRTVKSTLDGKLSASIGAQGANSVSGEIMRDLGYRPIGDVRVTDYGRDDLAIDAATSAAGSYGGIGAVVMRRPSVAEIEMGARGSDLLLMTTTATTSPFHRMSPVSISLMGHDNPLVTVSSEPGDISTPLYGDVDLSNVLNRLVSGASKGAGWVKDHVSWDNLSPAAKTTLGLLGAGATVYAGNKLLPNMMWYRLGKADGTQGGGDVQSPVMVTSPVDQMLRNASGSVNGMADVASLSSPIQPISNNFLAGAYALGADYGARKSQPSFGVLASDPRSVYRGLKGLRAPKFYCSGGRIIRSSAPYAAQFLTQINPTGFGLWWKAMPLQGGIILDVASDVLGTAWKGVKAVGKAIAGWFSSLFSKARKLWKKWTDPHTNLAAFTYNKLTTPGRLLLKMFNIMGVVPNNEIETLESRALEDMKYLQDNTYWNDTEQNRISAPDGNWADNEMITRARKMAAIMDGLCSQYGIPLQGRSWLMMGTPGGGQMSPQCETLALYAPETAKNVEHWLNSASNERIDVFDTREPPILFSDQKAMERDIQDFQISAQQELEKRGEDLAAAAPAVTVTNQQVADPATLASTSGQPQAAETDASPSVAPASFVNLQTGWSSDPTVLARQIAGVNFGMLSNMPQAWREQLPISVQRRLGAVVDPLDASPTALVGDVLPIGRLHAHDAPLVMCGNPAMLPAAAKFFATWVLPSLAALIPWQKVSGWFTKNATKTAALTWTTTSTEELVAGASKSGGFLGALSGALKTLLKRSNAMLKGLLGFMARNPKLSAIAAILAACLVMGTSYSKDSGGLGSLVSLLKKVLEELRTLGLISDDTCEAHISALDSIANKGADKLDEQSAQELQTVAIMGYSVACYLQQLNHGAELAKYTGLSELKRAVEAVAADSKMAADPEEMKQLQDLGARLITYYGSQPAEGSSGDDAGVGDGLSPGDVDASDAAIASALGSVGGSLMASSATGSKKSADKSGSAPSANDSGSVTAPNESGSAEASLLIAGQGGAATDGLTSEQMDDLQTLVDAASTMSPQAMSAEESGDSNEILESVKALLQKWGLPLAMASGIAAVVIKAVKARRSGTVDAKAEDGFDVVSSWWKRVVSDHSATPNAVTSDNFTGVAL